MELIHRICRNKHPGRLIFRSNKKNQKPLVLCTPPALLRFTHQSPSVLCTPPFEKSPIKTHRFCVLPPLKNHPSKPIGFVYSPLWKITHQNPLVLCSPPFEKPLFLVGAYFGVGIYFGKYGNTTKLLLHYCARLFSWHHVTAAPRPDMLVGATTFPPTINNVYNAGTSSDGEERLRPAEVSSYDPSGFRRPPAAETRSLNGEETPCKYVMNCSIGAMHRVPYVNVQLMHDFT